ncbi:hypothetical protein [Actinomadura madurae]|uniref:hypothetical protein n=1 Tax=Actinomadura madurae TaxID=1993 RepID=UPI0020D25B82|nr:hypothetical protein [Actinomadura madurae]MCP9969000.1 hypothetical protein [Actinomadura madurae]MCQ0017674.1 hypothetical protein [Actinomadura madurae]
MTARAGIGAVPAPGVLRGAWTGGAAGLAGGLVLGAAMRSFGMLPAVAVLAGSGSPGVGFALHMAISVLVGAGFGLLAVRQRIRSSELVFWGLAYGVFWWFLGTLTLLPLLTGVPMTWSLASAQSAMPSLLGHLYYGGVTAVGFALLHPDGRFAVKDHLRPRPLLRGLIAAGIVAGVLVLAFGVGGGARLGWLPAAAVAMGAGYPVVFTGRPEGTGPALVRGTAYGFLWWVAADLTLVPLVQDGALGWSQAVVAEEASRLPAYLLAGAGIAAVFGWLGGLARSLFVDDVRLLHRGAGTRGLRAVGYGALAGLVGGVVFGLLWGSVDALPTVARLVGARGAGAGWAVHLVIAQVIGVSYALFFRGRSYDLVSGVGWGLSYGFFWWVLGALTLLPVLLGQPPRWGGRGDRGGVREPDRAPRLRRRARHRVRVAGAPGEPVVGGAQRRRGRPRDRPQGADPRFGPRVVDADRPDRAGRPGDGGLTPTPRGRGIRRAVRGWPGSPRTSGGSRARTPCRASA